MASQQKRTAYLFLDEGGNLDFSPQGTRYFMMSSVLAYRPFAWEKSLCDLKFDIIESGVDKEYFHATEDEQLTRDKVFAAIRPHLSGFLVDSLIIEKCKVNPAKRTDEHFFPSTLGVLIGQVMRSPERRNWSNLIVLTDAPPIQKRRKAIEKAIKLTVAAMLPKGVPYRIYHHNSKSCCGLQVADYFNWAIYRKWDRNDLRSYELIQTAVRTEHDVLAKREERHY